jgi:hypothetical protein
MRDESYNIRKTMQEKTCSCLLKNELGFTLKGTMAGLHWNDSGLFIHLNRLS